MKAKKEEPKKQEKGSTALVELLQHASWLRKNGTPQEAIAIARYEEMLQRDIESQQAA